MDGIVPNRESRSHASLCPPLGARLLESRASVVINGPREVQPVVPTLPRRIPTFNQAFNCGEETQNTRSRVNNKLTVVPGDLYACGCPTDGVPMRPPHPGVGEVSLQRLQLARAELNSTTVMHHDACSTPFVSGRHQDGTEQDDAPAVDRAYGS